VISFQTWNPLVILVVVIPTGSSGIRRINCSRSSCTYQQVGPIGACWKVPFNMESVIGPVPVKGMAEKGGWVHGVSLLWPK
jgi:hypothetical protein